MRDSFWDFLGVLWAMRRNIIVCVVIFWVMSQLGC